MKICEIDIVSLYAYDTIQGSTHIRYPILRLYNCFTFSETKKREHSGHSKLIGRTQTVLSFLQM